MPTILAAALFAAAASAQPILSPAQRGELEALARRSAAFVPATAPAPAAPEPEGTHVVVSGYERLYLGYTREIGTENAHFDATERCAAKGFAAARPLEVTVTDHEVRGVYVCEQRALRMVTVSQRQYLGYDDAAVVAELDRQAAAECGKHGFIDKVLRARRRNTLDWRHIYACR